MSAPATLTVKPTVVAPGGMVQLPGWTVRNQGTVASNGFVNGFYLSSDPTITATDRLLTGLSNTALAAGAAFTWWSPTLTIPATIAPGNYYRVILVDRTNTTPESNEGNNYQS